MEACKAAKIVIVYFMELAFSRRSTAEKREAIKKDDSASFGLTYRAFKRTAAEGNCIANQQNK
jgi:hypothetical protein